MALWLCRECTTAYAVGLSACPHCRSRDYREDGAVSPKITVHEGPSIAGVTGAWSEEGTPDVWPAQATAAEGGEESSPGTDSSTSAETRESAHEPGKSAGRSPARTTASRSSKARTGKASSAGSTAGGRTGGPSQTASGQPADQ